jgi:hypothetical protein
MLEAHAKREVVAMATDVKNFMISGLWSNSNYDDGKQTRKRAIDEINENHQNLIMDLYGKMNKASKDVTETHPFFTAMQLVDVPSDTPIPGPHDLKQISEIDQM